ncbi:hypothetical protein ACWEN3_06850 [Streptomyces sp. NPDC004561]
MKAIKRAALGLPPSKSWQMNAAWVPAATIAADLHAWTGLLFLHDEPGLATAEPESLRTKFYHLPARLTLHLDRPWPLAAAFTTAWQRGHSAPGPHLTAGHHPDDTGEERTAPPSGPWNQTPSQRHVAAGPEAARDISGGQPLATSPSGPEESRSEPRYGYTSEFKSRVDTG